MEPRVTPSSHSVSFSITSVNTKDDLGHGGKEKQVGQTLGEEGEETQFGLQEQQIISLLKESFFSAGLEVGGESLVSVKWHKIHHC